MDGHNQYEGIRGEDASRRRSRWWHKISVEPVMFLYMGSYMLSTVVEQAFFVHKACTVDAGLPYDICANISAPGNEQYNKRVQMDQGNLNVEEVLHKLLAIRSENPDTLVQLTVEEMTCLCSLAREIFLQQPVLLEISAPMKICGDIHGQYSDLLRLFHFGGFPPQANYLFLGDYVDRGRQSLETICLLLIYKIKYPENFFLLRGNHECALLTKKYGFYEECKRRYNVKLWKTFIDCFNCMPIVAVVEEKIFCCHGGLSPDLKSLDQIRCIERPTPIPSEGLLCDLLWSDPDEDVVGWGENDRGISYTFGAGEVTKFLHRHNLQLVCRAHEVVEDGYKFFANRQLVTVFSAPSYCGDFDNAGAIMTVDETLLCSFQILEPAVKKLKYRFHNPNVGPSSNC